MPKDKKKTKPSIALTDDDVRMIAEHLRKWLEGPDIAMSPEAMEAAWGLVEAAEKGAV